MNNKMPTSLLMAATLTLIASSAIAKLPAPSDDAKAKAAETAAKAAWTGKVDAYKLCLAQNKVVAHYKKMPEAKAPAKAASSAATAGACADPGPFVYLLATANVAVAPWLLRLPLLSL